jgi:hypothetical protein
LRHSHTRLKVISKTADLGGTTMSILQETEYMWSALAENLRGDQEKAEPMERVERVEATSAE